MWLLLLPLACQEDPPPPADPLTAAGLEAATRAMTDLGHRMVATDHEEAARAAVVTLFTDAGLTAIVSEPFTWDAWTGGAATLSVGSETWPALPLSPSPITHGSLGPLTKTGDLDGAVYLASSDDGSRASQFADALLGGAEGLVRITEDRDPDGTRLIEVGHTLDGVSLPSLAVDSDVGDALWRLEGQEVTFDLEATLHTDHTSYNVLGQVDGTGDGRIFITAHYDSWAISECAFDNALGIGAMALLAQKLQEAPPRRTVVFLATSGEEQGLRGSQAWVEDHVEELADVEALINLDVLWSDAGTFYVSATETWLRELSLDHAFAVGLDAVDGGQPGLGSDHVPFMAQGVSAMWSTRQLSSHYHTIRDTIAYLDFDEALVAVDAQWRVLEDLAY